MALTVIVGILVSSRMDDLCQEMGEYLSETPGARIIGIIHNPSDNTYVAFYEVRYDSDHSRVVGTTE
jgi:hypothetical protein